jgi:hypothetical protein
MKKTQNPEVAAVLKGYPPIHRRKLLQIRDLIFEVARQTEGVGKIEETLKWGEPAYLTSESGSGSTVRIAWKKSEPEQCAVHFHCQTSLVSTFRKMFPDDLRFEGNRSIIILRDEVVPLEPLSGCIALALTYHKIKQSLRA